MQKKIAIMVIHGIGEQQPFETLDDFFKPFIRNYENRTKKAAVKKHVLLRYDPEWIESCIQVLPEGTGLPEFTICEYYWSYMTQRQITPAEIVQWTVQVAQAAKRFYFGKNASTYADPNDPLWKGNEFDHYKYLVRMLCWGNLVGRLLLLLKPLLKSVPGMVLLGNLLTAFPLRWIWVLCSKIAVDYFGDVALYCSMDKKSKYFEVRKKILDKAVEKARFMLKNQDYTDIIFVGHSLGSVIAYDTLDRLNTEMNVDKTLAIHADKIKGLVTCGSPLDKIAFFFDEHIDRKNQPVRHAIVSQLHGFKRGSLDHYFDDGIRQFFDNIVWLNFWAPTDIVSGRLHAYKGLNNIRFDFAGMNFIKSHLAYWNTDDMFERIMTEFKLC